METIKLRDEYMKQRKAENSACLGECGGEAN